MKILKSLTISSFERINFFLNLLKWDDDSKPIEIAITSLFLVWEFVLIFLICEPGERVTNQFGLFGAELKRCNWYVLSIDMQRMYVTFLLDTQQSINIQSYGGIQCTRETLKTVILRRVDGRTNRMNSFQHQSRFIF